MNLSIELDREEDGRWIAEVQLAHRQSQAFAFHDRDEIGLRVLARIAKSTGLRPEDL